jgi:hypothetical protein
MYIITQNILIKEISLTVKYCPGTILNQLEYSSYLVVILAINIIFTNYVSTHFLVYHTRFSHQVTILSGSKKLIIWFNIW